MQVSCLKNNDKELLESVEGAADKLLDATRIDGLAFRNESFSDGEGLPHFTAHTSALYCSRVDRENTASITVSLCHVCLDNNAFKHRWNYSTGTYTSIKYT